MNFFRRQLVSSPLPAPSAVDDLWPVAEPADAMPLDAPDEWEPELSVDGNPAVVLWSGEYYVRVRYVVRMGQMWRPTGQREMCSWSEVREYTGL